VKQKGEKKRKFWCTLLALGTSSCSAFILSAILSLRSCKQTRGKSETVATADQTSNPCSSASLLRAAEAVETSQNFGEKLGRATVVLKLKDAAGQTDALTRTDVNALKKRIGRGGKGGGRVAYTFGDAVRVRGLSPPRPHALLPRWRRPSSRQGSGSRCRPATRSRASSEALRWHWSAL
jgi:hypothetical protein